VKETLAQYMDRVLKQRKLKPVDVAELTGLSASYISRVLNGQKKNMTIETIAILVEKLDLDALEVFTAAYGKPISVNAGIDPLLLIDTFEKLVLNPDLIDLIQDLSRLPAKQQKTILETIRLMGRRSQRTKKKKR
jgi:transcriptional regulator with XRE-family HTH domain